MSALFAALRLTAELNALRHTSLSPEVAAHAVINDDPAHHVVDPDGLLGLDPLRANELDASLRALGLFVSSDFALVLPEPGRPGILRGPAGLTTDALDQGCAVVALEGPIAFVPHAVGCGLQWRVHAATPPAAPLSPAEAERALSLVVIDAAQNLGDLNAPAGERPCSRTPTILPPSYPERQRRAAERAWRLWRVADAGLDAEHEVLSAHAVGRRAEQLRVLRRAAADALCAAALWPTP